MPVKTTEEIVRLPSAPNLSRKTLVQELNDNSGRIIVSGSVTYLMDSILRIIHFTVFQAKFVNKLTKKQF